MRVYLRAELERFLEAIDAALDHRVDVIVIGGAACAVQYGYDGGTRDVDTWTKVQDDLAGAVAVARQKTGLQVPFSTSGVADGPWEFESRLERAMPHLQHLHVIVPERHDLVLMKLVRGMRHDLDMIEAIHQKAPLDLDVLVKRFEEEMGAVIGAPGALRLNFELMVDRLFPREYKRVSARLRNKRLDAFGSGPSKGRDEKGGRGR